MKTVAEIKALIEKIEGVISDCDKLPENAKRLMVDKRDKHKTQLAALRWVLDEGKS